MYDANIEVLWCYFYKDQFDDLGDMVTFPGELYMSYMCQKNKISYQAEVCKLKATSLTNQLPDTPIFRKSILFSKRL